MTPMPVGTGKWSSPRVDKTAERSRRYGGGTDSNGHYAGERITAAFRPTRRRRCKRKSARRKSGWAQPRLGENTARGDVTVAPGLARVNRYLLGKGGSIFADAAAVTMLHEFWLR